MLLLILGGVGSGKSSYAAQWAVSLGRESIRFGCPPFPDKAGESGVPYSLPQGEARYAWTELAADSSMAAKFDLINHESNIFRADRRVLVVDSLSGWLRSEVSQARAAGIVPEHPGRLDPSGPPGRLLESLLAFQGKRIVVSEEPSAGLASDPWERWYAEELAAAVRRLAEESHAVYRLTAGLAAELKGHRVKRRKSKDEHLYPNGG
jgi:adenosylcobinamide kinase/adenosylcobinamide-phosphate guanylyltransferase